MSEPNMHRPTWAEINLEHLAFNLRSTRRFIGGDVEYMAVVKADAYGHGAVECARRLAAEGVDWLGVALPEEGLQLRQNGIRTPVLCLGGFWPGQEDFMLRERLTPVVFQLEKAELLNRAAARSGQTFGIHVKVDTGMGRLGIRFDEVAEFAENLKNYSNLRLEGLMTHFAAADDPRKNDFTDTQIERFHRAVEVFEEKGFRPFYKDLANSPGAVAHRGSRGNLVRLGGILYGLSGDVLPPDVDRPELRPVMALETRVTQLKRVPAGETIGYGRTFRTSRESLIAAVPIGYRDGYRRSLSGRGRVIVRKTFAPVVGRISMDWTLLDVTDVPGVKIDDRVTLIGAQDDLRITAEDLAQTIGTISYEITCGISERVVRKFAGR